MDFTLKIYHKRGKKGTKWSSVVFLALEKLLTLQSPDAVFAFTNEMCNLHRGQGRDIFWRTSSHIASEEEYLQMVQDKTGGLFRLAIRVMYAVAPPQASLNLDDDDDNSTHPGMFHGDVEDLILLANDLASFFQIRDDLINLASPSFHAKKGFCEDITEGKLSFIALHSLRALSGTDKFTELMKILQMKTVDKAIIQRSLVIMDGTGSFTYCLKYLQQVQKRIEQGISKLGGNSDLSSVLASLAADLEDCKDIQNVIHL